MVYNNPDYIDESGAQIPVDLSDTTPEFIDRDMYVWIASHYGALPPSLSSITIPRRVFDVVGLFNPDYRMAGDLEFYNRVAQKYAILRNRHVLHSVRSHAGATQQSSRAGATYLAEEALLDDWYRQWWSAADFRSVKRFRSALRGRYHLGWIRRLARQGEFGPAAKALRQLNKVYPLRWVLSWEILRILRPGFRVTPTVPAPPRLTGITMPHLGLDDLEVRE
ncbi:MAG: hypothetical protein WDN48_16460 [Pseudolabrys sp.]